jgi:hypothetical protein
MVDRPLEDWEYPDPDDDEDEEESETVACPACGEQVYEHADQCPDCGEYIVHGTSVLAGRSLGFVLLALLGIVAVIWLLVRV